MIVSDIKTRVKRTFGDESGVQITDEDIVRWINDGQRQICVQNDNLLEKSALASLIAEQNEYTLPSDLLIFKSISVQYANELSYRRVTGYDFVKFNRFIDGWDGTDQSSGRPVAYTIHAGNIIVFPNPDRAVTDGLKIYYNRKPIDVADDVDTPDLPELYHETLVKYCLVQAYKLDEDYDAAGAESADMTNDVTFLRQRDSWKEQETYPTITVMPEDQYSWWGWL